MPYRKSYRNRRRRPRRMRRRKRRARQRIPRQSLLGDKRIVKLRYHDTAILFTSPAGLATSMVFSANGMFDPNISGTGHQPRGFDQLLLLYDHFVVLGSKCTATFLQHIDIDPDDTTKSQAVGIILRDNATSFLQPDDIFEDRNVSWKYISNTTSGGPVRVSCKFSAKRFLGRASVMSDPELKGSISSNPEEQAYYHVFVSPVGFAEVAGDVQISIDIVFIAMLIEPRLPPIS